MRAVVLAAYPAPKKQFRQFQTGDWLIAVDTGHVGIKTDDGGILWVTGESAGKQTDRRDVSHGKEYAEPKSVEVQV